MKLNLNGGGGEPWARGTRRRPFLRRHGFVSPLLGILRLASRHLQMTPPTLGGRGTGSDPALLQPGREQVQCAGQLGQVFKRERNQLSASLPAGVRRGMLGPHRAGTGKANCGTPRTPLSLLGFLGCCDAVGWAGGGESRRVGGSRQRCPSPHPPETPPSVVQSGDSIHVKPTFLEPTGPARSSHTGRSLSCLMRK